MYTYPTAADDYTRITDILGSYWPGTYGGAGLVISFGQAINAVQQQLFQNTLELQNSVGMYTCPVLNKQLWYNLVINKSQFDAVALKAPIPSDLATIYWLANDILNPTAMMTEGTDFVRGDGNDNIYFIENIFNDSRFTQQPIYDSTGTTIIDYSISLWILHAGIDNQWVYEQFGYVIPLNLPSSYEYKNAVTSILSAYASATSYNNVAQLLSAITDTPIVKTDGETVEVVTQDAVQNLVITDKNVYKFSLAATPIVSVGQIVNKSDQLVDTVAIYTSNAGVAPPLSSLELGPGFLDPNIAGPLTFNNSSTSLVVTLNVSGYTKVSWALGGAGGDVTNFFNILHTKGIAAGKTLAMCMDERPQPQATQPTAFNLPATINPMVFLYQNVLRANAFTVVIKTAGLGPNSLNVPSTAALLRNIVPPHNAAILVIE